LGLLKFAVSVTLVALVLRRVSLRDLRAELAHTEPARLLLPFGLLAFANLLGATQWHWILRSTRLDPGFGRVLRTYWIGLFLNNFMLGSLGGDLFKVYRVGRDARDMGRVAGATIVDRMVGFTALCALALVASLSEIGRMRLPLEQTLLVAGFSIAVMGSAGLLLHPRGGEWLARYIARLRLGGWGARLGRLLDHLREFRRRPRLLNGAFLLSLLVQGARVVAHFCVGMALGWGLQAADLTKFFLVIPILGLVIALPISFGGWGVREWAGVALFAPLGHGGEEAVALLALTATLNLVASLGGAVAFAAERRHDAARTAAA